MKTKTNRKIGLKKLTIAKISVDKMQQVNGGDCLPTEHYVPSGTCHLTYYAYCGSVGCSR